MGRNNNYRFRDMMSEYEYNNSKTVYNGEVCTIAEAKARKAAETRKKKADEKKLRKQKEEVYTRDVILPSLRDFCRRIRKSVKMLNSLRAFHRNGRGQWHKRYDEFMKMFPEISKNLSSYVTLYDKIVETEHSLSSLLKKNKCDKACFSFIDKFGYQMYELLDIADRFSMSVTKSGAATMPGWSTHEIICGAADGKRVGLLKIQQQMFSAQKQVRADLIELARQSQESYNDLMSFAV